MSKRLTDLTIAEASKLLKEKQVTSQELTQAYLDRIEDTNDLTNSYIKINPKAIEQAKKADKLRASAKGEVSDLLGIPYGLKDNFTTIDLQTSAASKVLDGFSPKYQATVVNKLSKAGAIILGKTNMDAWAHGSSTETSDYGTVKNPWDINRYPGGSSGGSAAATAADQAVFTIGSETAGSIRQPAAWCGITGLKPTYGRVSRYGVVAMASSTDSPGPMTKTVADAVTVLQTIAGQDLNDATTHPDKIDLDINKILNSDSLSGIRVGVPKEYMLKQMKPAVIDKIKRAIQVLEQAGAEIVEISLIDPEYAIGVYTIVQRSEVSSNLARFDGVRYGHGREEFGAEAKRRILLGTYALSSGYYDQYYNKAQQVRQLIIDDFKKAYQQVDVIVGPVSPSTALPIGAAEDQAMFGELEDILVEASSVAGLPSYSVPVGFVDGLPVGMQITGSYFQEQLISEVAHVYQQATDHHLARPKLEK